MKIVKLVSWSLLFIFGISTSTALAAGNADAGRKVYKTCGGCHSLAENRTGPRHCGLIGRKAGTEKGFNFSGAMRNSGLVWNAETLDKFITSPMDMVPGTSMGFAGIKNATKRADLLAYLLKVSDSKTVCSGKKKKKLEK